MTDLEILRVVEAHIEGKGIEMRGPGQGWVKSELPQWNFRDFEYRVAPEPPKPREFWIWDRDEFVIGCRSREETQSRYFVNDPSKLIHVREVIGVSSGNPAVASDTASCKHQLAESFRRIAETLLKCGHPANSSAKAMTIEAERLNE